MSAAPRRLACKAGQCTCACVCACTCACARALVRVCMCKCVCVHVHVCWAGSRRSLLALSWDRGSQGGGRGLGAGAEPCRVLGAFQTLLSQRQACATDPGVGTSFSGIKAGGTEEEVAVPSGMVPCGKLGPSHGLPPLSRLCLARGGFLTPLPPSAPSRPHVRPPPPQEQERSEKASRRAGTVSEVRSHVAALREMLGAHRRPGPAPPDQGALQVAARAGGGGRGAACVGGVVVGFDACTSSRRHHDRASARALAPLPRLPVPRQPAGCAFPFVCISQTRASAARRLAPPATPRSPRTPAPASVPALPTAVAPRGSARVARAPRPCASVGHTRPVWRGVCSRHWPVFCWVVSLIFSRQSSLSWVQSPYRFPPIVGAAFPPF